MIGVVLTAVLLLGAAVLLIPVTVLAVQVFSARVSSPPFEGAVVASAAEAVPPIVVLIPAHDEADGIDATLKSVLSQLRPQDRLLVVADNCTDATADVAGRAGAEVLERRNLVQRGKGYALDHGVRHLAASASLPAVVVVLDADCIALPGCIVRLASACVSSGRPMQARYLLTAPQQSNLRARMAEFAGRVKNWVRPAGMHAWGLPCQLMGAGMAFSWHQIATAQLATGHIVEDLKLGLELADAGFAPRYCAAAQVLSAFPANEQGARSQRTRWEHGHLQMIVSDVPRWFARALRTGNRDLFSLTLDLVVPPLALLAMAIVGWLGVCLLAWVTMGVAGPAWVMLVCVALLGATVLQAWRRVGRTIVTFAELASAPLYALRKIPLYLLFVVRRQVDWVRSKRDVQ